MSTNPAEILQTAEPFGAVPSAERKLLAVVVALAPPPPSGVGEYGYSEIQVPTGEGPHARQAEPERRQPANLSGWLMALTLLLKQTHG
jgi:hypothetical protein